MKVWKAMSFGLFLALGTPTLASAQTVEQRPAPDFTAGGQWFNSPPLSIHDLRGKVVLVNVWVYSCINCSSSLPTLQGSYSRFKNQGFEIVGVHTPEFESDEPASSVAAAIRKEKVTWPVVQDNARATWKAYQAEFWPSFYLIDRKGNIRAVYSGEISSRFPRQIPAIEKAIQELVTEPSPAG
jgi:peroxiredoxin